MIVASSVQRLGIRETTNHPTMHSQPSAAHNYLAHNISGVEVEKPFSTAGIFGQKGKGWWEVY